MPQFTSTGVWVDRWYNNVCVVGEFDQRVAYVHWLEVRRSDNERRWEKMKDAKLFMTLAKMSASSEVSPSNLVQCEWPLKKSLIQLYTASGRARRVVFSTRTACWPYQKLYWSLMRTHEQTAVCLAWWRRCGGGWWEQQPWSRWVWTQTGRRSSVPVAASVALGKQVYRRRYESRRSSKPKLQQENKK